MYHETRNVMGCLLCRSFQGDNRTCFGFSVYKIFASFLRWPCWYKTGVVIFIAAFMEIYNTESTWKWIMALISCRNNLVKVHCITHQFLTFDICWSVTRSVVWKCSVKDEVTFFECVLLASVQFPGVTKKKNENYIYCFKLRNRTLFMTYK